jgi:hypothetical protein
VKPSDALSHPDVVWLKARMIEKYTDLVTPGDPSADELRAVDALLLDAVDGAMLGVEIEVPA